MTQDCQFVGSYDDIAVACVNQQCMTYATDAGSDVRGLEADPSSSSSS